MLSTCTLRRIGLLAQRLSDLAGECLGRLGEILERLLHGLLHQFPGTHHRPRQHPHPIGQQTIVTGCTDVALHHRAIRAQLATLRHPALCGQLNDPFLEFLQGLRLNEVRPADQGRVIRHILQIYPAERSQTQAISHRSLRLFIAVAIQPLHHQHPQHHLHRRRVPPRFLRLWISLCQIRPDQLVQLLILQIPIDFS